MGITKEQLAASIRQIKQYIDENTGRNGEDGLTPSIGANGNWFIGDVDTNIPAQGKDGKSISTVDRDENNNVIVTFTDGTSKNIGNLSFNISGSFFTSDGFGGLRYYNGVLQSYNDSSGVWNDIDITPENIYIINMMPQPMKRIVGAYDIDDQKYKLKWEEPDDTIIDGQIACKVDKVVIRRKLGSAPTDENDGDLVIEVKRKDFGAYKTAWYTDDSVDPSLGDIYYYKAFPVSTTGFYNYSTVNETSGILCKDYILYGFKIDQNESDPASMITYIEDNKDFSSAYMNYTNGLFNYGDWKGAWFIRDLKPCMLKYDGTVDYELDKNDYTKKIDGAASDVTNDSYEGNAMMGFPKVYWKIVDNGDDTANVYISNKKVDDDFVCWSHIDNNGNEIDYCYMPIYNGSLVDGKLRSLSGKSLLINNTAQSEINYAKANNLTDDVIWYTEVYCDIVLLQLLLTLIGKSTDSQTVFGNGHYTDASNTASSLLKTGTMNTKGLFWGTNGTWNGVKVFGIENFYGNQWHRVAGYMYVSGAQKVKMTYAQSDGSTTDGYNTDGAGYVEISDSTCSGTSGGYISKMKFTKNGFLPLVASGSSTTKYCDGLWFTNGITYLLFGGYSLNGAHVGFFCYLLDGVASLSDWSVGASLSCKPLAQIS